MPSLPDKKARSPHTFARTAWLRGGFWALHFFALTVAAFWLAWCLLTPLDFGFRAGYHLLDIDAHINEFGPQNLYRHGYENTTQEQRFDHFRAIVRAINAGGKGLSRITYENGQTPAPTLLRTPEIVHLQDVAALVTKFHLAGPLMLALWVVACMVAKNRGWRMPEVRQLVGGTLLVLALCGAILGLVGPTHAFYWLHTHVFPENHQWFFYYQESLMTTLMKAPDLFGFIAVLWLLFAMLLMAVAIAVERRWLGMTASIGGK